MSVPVSESTTTPEILPPDMYLNLRLPTEVNETPLPSFLSHASGLSEHEYISVIDIEDKDILNNLPVIPESAEEIATAQQNEQFEIPSTEKLHHMAASVINAVPPKALQKKDDLKNVSSPVQKEDKELPSARDSVTWNVIHEDDRTTPSSGLPSKVIGKNYFSAKQQEMYMRLQTLQNITENMEEDFRNTKLLVKIIEDFEMAANSDLGTRPSFSEDDRIIGDEHYLRGLIFEDITDDEKDRLNLEYPVPSYTALEVSSPASSASASNFRNGIKSSSGIILNAFNALILS
uniref:Ciliogenesis and planar polarity effector 1 n=1 Tax=Athene cunicularia TaxID=194338 RepID=A0A663N8M6_ATHCN